jgi:hypothetical protein
MKNAVRVAGVVILLVLGVVVWYSMASNYGEGVVSGAYNLAQNGEVSTLILKRDHSFQQELIRSGNVQRAAGTWRRIGESGIAFSKEFLLISGQEPGADGTTYGDIHKAFGFRVYLTLSQYHVLWYGRVDPSSDNSIAGTYRGDEPGVLATMVVKPDHTFQQSVDHLGATKHVEGRWILNQNGDVVFSRAFLKTSGEALEEDETASAWDPKGSNLQIQIAMTSNSGIPTFRKQQFSW